MNVSAKRSDAERSGQIQSVARAISVLNALAADEDGMTLTQIAHTVTLPPSTVHRLLTTLQQERYVRFDTERGAWQIGVQCFAVGSVPAHAGFCSDYPALHAAIDGRKRGDREFGGAATMT